MSKKVILIEDDFFIRDLYKRQFTLSGIEIEAFANGRDGLEALKKNKYDIVLLDIMLPDINGIDILKQIKDDPVNKDLPVVFLTNMGQESIIKEGFALGAEDYLIKAAYTPNQVVEKTKARLAGQKISPPNPSTDNR